MPSMSPSRLVGVISANSRDSLAQFLTKGRYLSPFGSCGRSHCFTSSLTEMSCELSRHFCLAFRRLSREKSGSVSRLTVTSASKSKAVLTVLLRQSRTDFSASGCQGCSLKCFLSTLQLAIFSSCAMLARIPSFSASSSLVFLKMMMRLCSMMFLTMRSTTPVSWCFSFSSVACICFRRFTIVSSFISAGAFVIAIPMLSSRLSSSRLSGRKSSRNPSSAFFQGMILVRVDFSSMKTRKPTRLVLPTIRSTVSFCSRAVHFFVSGGQMKEGTSTSLSSSLSLRDFSQSAGQAVCILMVLVEMTPSRLYTDLPASKARPGVMALQQYLRTSSAKVVLPVWLGPISRMHCGMRPRQFQLFTVLPTVTFSSISTNKSIIIPTCIAYNCQKSVIYLKLYFLYLN